jgi:UDP-N-acetylmuramate--alanine ligase
MRLRGHRDVRPLEGPDDLPAIVAESVGPGDMVVLLGAGSITQWAHALPGSLAELDRRAVAE